MDLNPVAVTYTIYKLQLVISYSSSFWFVRYWLMRVVRVAFDLLDIGGLGLIALLICFFWSRCSVSAAQGTNRGKKWQQLPLFGVRILACKFNFLIFCLSMKIVRRENFNLFYKFAVIKKRHNHILKSICKEGCCSFYVGRKARNGGVSFVMGGDGKSFFSFSKLRK